MAFPEGFYFTENQKKGILVLALIILLLSVGRALWLWLPDPALAPMPELEASGLEEEPLSLSHSTLDINATDTAAWEALPGIGPVLARRILRFRAGVGGFDSVKQVAKTYGLPAETFAQIEPQLRYEPRTRDSLRAQVKQAVRRSYPTLDLNQATAAELQQLPGLGPVLSERIVKYRRKLGGFSSVADLQAVYGLPPETLERLTPYLRLSAPAQPALAVEPLTTPLDLNQADSTALMRLPGIEASLVRRILRYRQLLGFFYAVEQLRAVYGLAEEQLQAWQPLLQVNSLGKYPKRNLNQATAVQLAYLNEVDDATAEQIITQRQALGAFNTWAEVEALVNLSPAALRELKIYYQF